MKRTFLRWTLAFIVTGITIIAKAQFGGTGGTPGAGGTGGDSRPRAAVRLCHLMGE